MYIISYFTGAPLWFYFCQDQFFVLLWENYKLNNLLFFKNVWNVWKKDIWLSHCSGPQFLQDFVIAWIKAKIKETHKNRRSLRFSTDLDQDTLCDIITMHVQPNPNSNLSPNSNPSPKPSAAVYQLLNTSQVIERKIDDSWIFCDLELCELVLELWFNPKLKFEAVSGLYSGSSSTIWMLWTSDHRTAWRKRTSS